MNARDRQSIEWHLEKAQLDVEKARSLGVDGGYLALCCELSAVEHIKKAIAIKVNPEERNERKQ